MNQREWILAELKTHGKVCGDEMLHWGIARYAARIHELRSLGYRIESHPCKEHKHRATVFEYTLEKPYV